MKKCTSCKIEKQSSDFPPQKLKKDGRSSHCRECHKKSYKKWYYSGGKIVGRKANQRWRKKNTDKYKENTARNYTSKDKLTDPIKIKANMEFRKALKTGKIKREPCEFCGNPKSEGHHHDYTKPLLVRWVCKRHHLLVHSFIRDFIEFNK